MGEPETYRIAAVIAAICFWPTGLLSLYHSLQVRKPHTTNDITLKLNQCICIDIHIGYRYSGSTEEEILLVLKRHHKRPTTMWS